MLGALGDGAEEVADQAQLALGELHAPRVRLEETGADTPILEAVSLRQTGRYEVQGRIARGGVGIVLKGRDTDLARDVALSAPDEAIEPFAQAVYDGWPSVPSGDVHQALGAVMVRSAYALVADRADAGNLTCTAASDRFTASLDVTTADWDDFYFTDGEGNEISLIDGSGKDGDRNIVSARSCYR